jgi:hypothetical protein
MNITKEYLKQHPDHIFVFGDNTLRKGKKGAAELRDEPNTYGFITKKEPNNKDNSFYTIEEYEKIFKIELQRLICEIETNPNCLFLISKLGAGLANKYGIWEYIIEPQLKEILSKYNNVKFLY